MKQKLVSLLSGSLLLVAFSFFFLLAFGSVGECAEEKTYLITETQLNELESRYQTALSINNELLNLLEESNKDLNEASEISERLKAELKSLQEKSKKLEMQLVESKQETSYAKNSLEEANRQLAEASKSFKEYEKQNNREKNLLKMQRNILLAAALIFGGGWALSS